jgi:site-specific DNA-methyltransferase (adenine-specific)
MSINPGVMSSILQDWETPQSFIDKLPVTFDLDSCTHPSAAKATKYFTQKQDALTKKWDGVVWMNPPYGKALPKWLKYAYEQSLRTKNKAVWCLVPARTDTAWFHEWACKGKIILLKGRISFLQQGKKVGSPAFPSMLVIYDKNISHSISTWDYKHDSF